MKKYRLLLCILSIAIMMSMVCTTVPSEANMPIMYALKLEFSKVQEFLALDKEADNLAELAEAIAVVQYPHGNTLEERNQFVLEFIEGIENLDFILLGEEGPDYLYYNAVYGFIRTEWIYIGEGVNLRRCTVYLDPAVTEELIRRGQYQIRVPKELGKNLYLYNVIENNWTSAESDSYSWTGYLKYKDIYIVCIFDCTVGSSYALNSEEIVQLIGNADIAKLTEYNNQEEKPFKDSNIIYYICAVVSVTVITVAVVVVAKLKKQ